MKGINLNSKNGQWKGDKVSFIALHNWVRRWKPKAKVCECCNTNKPRDLANISQEYKRDLSDFEWLCRECHMRKDGRMEALIKRNRNGGHIVWNKGMKGIHLSPRTEFKKGQKSWKKRK